MKYGGITNTQQEELLIKSTGAKVYSIFGNGDNGIIS
jgi:hypothetical protein